MSDTANTFPGHDALGRFAVGNTIGAKGRGIGSRAKLAESFIDDCYEAWQRHGVASLEKLAATDVAAFCKLISGLLPAKLDVDVSVDITNHVERLRLLAELVGVSLSSPHTGHVPRDLSQKLIEVEEEPEIIDPFAVRVR
jgi:hypothetical protein